MSGDTKEYLQDPVIYPNWMWVLGVTLLAAVIGWIVYCLWRWWTSRIGEVMELQTITDARRKKYLRYIDQIADRYADADLDARGVHPARSVPVVTLRSRPCVRSASSCPCGRDWQTSWRHARSPASRVRTSPSASPRTRL